MAANFIDSSVLIAFFKEDDSLHERAFQVIRDGAKPVLVHEYVALETATVLMVKAGKEVADEFMKVLLTNADFKPVFSNETHFFLTAHKFIANKTQLSFTDAALLELSAAFPVITFDKALQKAMDKHKKAKT